MSGKQCPHCPSIYKFQSSLNKHIIKKHPEENKENVKSGRIFCQTCSERFSTLNQLINHLETSHKEQIPITKHTFESIKEFHEWKNEEEKSSKSLFVQDSGSRLQGLNRKRYFYCHRSGVFKAKGKGLRAIKTQGSCKIDCFCTANMQVMEDTVTGKVIVSYCSHHIGHDLDLCHLKIPSEVKMQIAAKLQLGVSIERILDDIRDNVTASNSIAREHLIARQDINNIRYDLNLQSIEKHQNDYVSVAAWVAEMQGMAYNPVLIFKNQGEKQGDDCDNLGQDDFLLAIQTEYQYDMMLKNGNKVICMDDTHSTNVYDFSLITVLVVDDHGEGVPVAWALANRTDAALLREFLKPLLARVGPMQPTVFMSDMADQFYIAWIGVFGAGETRHLYCTWHVDKAWRKGLIANVETNQDRIELYHHMRLLLQETDEGAFHVLLQQLLSHLLQNFPKFSAYFSETYVSCTKKWAFCYRKGAAVNTNMFVEAFHRKLKSVYLEKKQNRRIDKLLFILLKLARDLIFEGMRKEEIGKRSHRKCEIRKRCQTAVAMQKEGVGASLISENSWSVTSSAATSFYTVSVSKESCDCQLRCSNCGACVHMYICSCVDHAIHYTVCKHIHLVHMQRTNGDEEAAPPTLNLDNNDSDNNDSDNNEMEEGGVLGDCGLDLKMKDYESTTSEEEEVMSDSHGIVNDRLETNNVDGDQNELTNNKGGLQYYSELLQSSCKATSVVSSKQVFVDKMSELQVLVNSCDSHDMINTVCTHLSSAINVLKASKATPTMMSSSLNVTKHPAPNSNSVKQFRFHSTKKKRCKQFRWAKPSREEESSSKRTMENTVIEVCGICMKQDDNRGNDVIEWIECSKCKLWVHAACIRDPFDTEDYLCFNCK